jgi:protein-S-isoprenylcysteine O-methyltransferase Ste14
MQSIITFFLEFTGKEYSPFRKMISMIPGIIIFLIISPLVIFYISRYLSSFYPVEIPRTVELVTMTAALLTGISLMSWALFELWTTGRGTPAPIAPTSRLVVSGPYRWCRNPIELGTNIYFLALGIFFDSLVTGILCMFFGLVLGTLYIKLIEEKEMLVRFGQPYADYLQTVPFMAFPFLSKQAPVSHD